MFGWPVESSKWLHPDDIFDEIIGKVRLVEPGEDEGALLMDVVTKEDENFIYALCEAMASGINARHPSWWKQ